MENKTNKLMEDWAKKKTGIKPVFFYNYKIFLLFIPP